MPRCFAQMNPVFQPAMRLIAAITQSFPATVTTTFDHQYIDGTIVRLDIPPACGMQEANQFFGPLTVTGATTFTLPLDSTNFQAFSIPIAPDPHTDICAQVVPMGEISATLKAATVNVLPI